MRTITAKGEVGDIGAEVRGILYQMVKDVFPHVAEIVGADLGKHFQEIDGDAWYDAGPYLETIRYLTERISPQVTSLIGRQLIEVFRQEISARGIDKPQQLLESAPLLYRELARGEGAGEWKVEERAPGRIILSETGITANPNFAAGVIKAGLEMVGAYNVRVTVLDEREKGAAANRYLVEWLEVNAGG